MGTTWGDLFCAPPVPRSGDIIIRTVYEYGVDHARAAEARMRQLRGEIEGLRRENAQLENRLAVQVDQERRARMSTMDL
ncbi:hypothetical protein [Microvirga sp. G4-2]|uniref:hypothetical protein n=1 Tax=Microvirga sp. G4-2 TaxID=3434467 RepID=UPI004043F8E6